MSCEAAFRTSNLLNYIEHLDCEPLPHCKECQAFDSRENVLAHAFNLDLGDASYSPGQPSGNNSSGMCARDIQTPNEVYMIVRESTFK